MTVAVTSVAETAIRAIRAELGWRHMSQRQLAVQLGWDQAYMQRRLSHRTPLSLDDVDAIAAGLGLSPFDLVKPRGEQDS